VIAVEVEEDAWRAVPDVEAVTARAAEAALASEPGDLVIVLADDNAVAEVNGRFRDKPRPTNVLSFPAAESAWPHRGDLILASGVCRAEAEAQGKTLADHLTHLVVHGVLHVLGHDHGRDDEAEAMEAEERRILAALGVADPYETRHAG
jgi:probable rRNA maturation factor